MPEASRAFAIETSDGVTLAGEESGEGAPIVLLHGLTATRRYVVMGSRLLQRSGHRVIAYDARGHGRSTPARSPGAYTYDLLAGDLLAVLDALNVRHAVLAGVSMGAQTALRFALEHPERVAALGLITPAFDPERHGLSGYGKWDRLAQGLRESGVEGFVAAYDLAAVPERWRETVLTVLHQRLGAHEHPLAVADALETAPRSRPFQGWEQLASIGATALVVGSLDDADGDHPLTVAEHYSRAMPGARLVVESVGESPLAWQGGRISRLIARLADAGS